MCGPFWSSSFPVRRANQAKGEPKQQQLGALQLQPLSRARIIADLLLAWHSHILFFVETSSFSSEGEVHSKHVARQGESSAAEDGHNCYTRFDCENYAVSSEEAARAEAGEPEGTDDEAAAAALLMRMEEGAATEVDADEAEEEEAAAGAAGCGVMLTVRDLLPS